MSFKPKPGTKSYPEFWFKAHSPYYMSGKDLIVHKNYLHRAKMRELAGLDTVEGQKNRKTAVLTFVNFRDYIIQFWDCTTATHSNDKGKRKSEFQILDFEGKPVMNVICQKQVNEWSCGLLIFDSLGFGKKEVRLRAISEWRPYWRSMFWNYLLPFIDDCKSIKIRLEGIAKENTVILCLADYAKCLNLKVTAGMDRLYLIDYNVLITHKNGILLTDNPKFAGRYSFGQMCHILNLIAGKPEIVI